MENNFNLKSFLTENKLTPLSKQLNEQADKNVIKAFRKAGLTGQVTVVFHPDSGMDEPDVEVLNARSALAMITKEISNVDSEDVIITQGSEIDQQGGLQPETEGLEAKLEVAVLDHGTYEIYQGTNSGKQLNEARDEGDKMKFIIDFLEIYSQGVPELDVLEELEDRAEYSIPDQINNRILEKAVSQLELAINDVYSSVFESENLSEQENKGPKIYNFKLTRREYFNDVDIWKDNSLTIADLKDGNFKRVSLNLNYDFAELFEAGNEEGFLVIYSRGEGKRYDRDPSNWTEEQFLRLESAIEDVY